MLKIFTFKYIYIYISKDAAHNPGYVANCKSSEILKDFSNFVLARSGYKEASVRKMLSATNSLQVTFIIRKDRPDGTLVARKIKNENQLADIIRSKSRPGLDVNVTLVDFFSMSFDAQMDIIRRTHILVGAHGAGLTWELFLPDGVRRIIRIIR